MKRLEATHFIEVYRFLFSERNVSTDYNCLTQLNRYLKATENVKGATIAIFKIRFK